MGGVRKEGRKRGRANGEQKEREDREKREDWKQGVNI